MLVAASLMPHAYALSIVLPIEFSPPMLMTMHSTQANDAKVGQQLLIQSLVTNKYNPDAQAVVIIEVKDEDGFTQHLTWQSVEMKGHAEMTVGTSWTPAREGTYELRIFAIKSFPIDWDSIFHISLDSEFPLASNLYASEVSIRDS